MRHGFTTMEEIRNGMENMLDAKTMMVLSGYKGWTYTPAIARELIGEIDDTHYCKETVLWAFDYACSEWGFYDSHVEALNILIEAWLTEEVEA